MGTPHVRPPVTCRPARAAGRSSWRALLAASADTVRLAVRWGRPRLDRCTACVRPALVLLVTAALVATGLAAAAPAAADDTTVSYDTYRTGWDPNEPNLNSSTVAASDYGRLFATQLDGQVYAQPIVANGTLLVATENDKLYGLDPVSGTIRWTRDVGPAWPVSAIGCGDLVPNIGITGTPVYDAEHRHRLLHREGRRRHRPAAPALVPACGRRLDRRRARELPGRDRGHAVEQPGPPVQPVHRDAASGPAADGRSRLRRLRQPLRLRPVRRLRHRLGRHHRRADGHVVHPGGFGRRRRRDLAGGRRPGVGRPGTDLRGDRQRPLAGSRAGHVAAREPRRVRHPARRRGQRDDHLQGLLLARQQHQSRRRRRRPRVRRATRRFPTVTAHPRTRTCSSRSARTAGCSCSTATTSAGPGRARAAPTRRCRSAARTTASGAIRPSSAPARATST